MKTDQNLSIKDIIGPDKEMILAKFVQNALHPKNSGRVDAIKNGTYKNIINKAEAHDYLL